MALLLLPDINIHSFSIIVPHVYHLLPNLWKVSYAIRASTSVDVQQWPPYSMNNLHSRVVTFSSQRCRLLEFPASSSSSSTQEKGTTLVGNEPIILQDNGGAHTANAVKDLRRCWRWAILEHPPYLPNVSECDYDLFADIREPLRGTRYSTREEIIRALERSLLDMNRSAHADCIQPLAQIWQKVVHVGGDYIEGM
jgi:hypothetical protein